jgi:hypothetical protein
MPLAAPAPRAAYLPRKVQQRLVTTTRQEAPHQSAQGFSTRLDLGLAVQVHVGFAGEGFSLGAFGAASLTSCIPSSWAAARLCG